MAAPVEIQLRNAQSSVLFMQQEHAQTLQGLHSELQKLQKKCAELTFELAMKEGSPDEEHYKKQIKVLEAEIKESKTEKAHLEKEVDKKERRIATLEQQLKVHEKKYLDEIKKQKQTGNRYKTDLDKKSEMIAHLTSQLHQFNLNKHKRTVSLDEDYTRTGTPQPPSEPRPNFRRPHKHVRSPEEGTVRKGHRPMRAIPVDGINHDGLTLSELRQQYSRTRSTDNTSDSTVNVSAFLVQTEPKGSIEVGVKVAPPVLPPIHSRRGTRSPRHPSPAILATKDDKSRLTHGTRKDSMSPEKHTLAVKKVFSNEKKLYHVEESKSD